MLRTAIAFFVMGLFVFLLGFYGFLNVSYEGGKLFLFAFTFFSFLSFLGAIALGKSEDQFV